MRSLRVVLTSLALLVLGSVSVLAQSAPVKFLSAASNNATLVKTGRTLLKVLLPINTTSTTYYLHLYSKATVPVCGTDVPLWTVPVPNAAGAGAGVALPSEGLMFPLGLGFCLTAGIADTDNVNAATGVAINLGVTGY